MSVHYKFKSALESDIVSFDGLHISVADLKKAIFHQKRIGKNADFDLLITNAETKEDYTDDNTLIPKNTSLIVARVPVTVQQKRSWNRSEPQSFVNLKDESNLGHAVDLTRLDGSEEDKIRAMMTQSTQDYDPSNYMKIRGANQSGDLPPKYRCNKCHQPGHWIKNCPLGASQEPIEIKKSTGIPRSFMVPVDGPSVPGAMMTPTGQYAVPAIDHQAYKEGKKERPPFSNDPEPLVKKPEIPEDLLCNLCKDLLTDAVMIPCCGNSFCDECIRTLLLESEEHQCPDCPEKDISPENLIPSRFLRNAVMNFKNETGYAKQQTYQSAGKNSAAKSAAPVTPSIEKEKIENPVLPTPVESKESSKELPTAEPENSPAPQDTNKVLLDPGINEKLAKLDVQSEIIVHPSTIEEESDVVPPPPPGTEPLLPIPSVNSSPEKNSQVVADEKKDYDYEYEEDQRSRERHQSFSKDNRERSGDNRRTDNVRPVTKRRSLSPRQSRRNDYPIHNAPTHQPINSVKGYQNIPSSNSTQYNTNTQHYDSEIRRTDEDPNSAPVMDSHQYPPSTAHQAPLLPYPPGEDRIPSLQPPPPQGYNQPPPVMQPHNPPPPMSDPYMGHRMPMYPHQQGPHYGPPRYTRPQYQQQGYRPAQPRNYNGPPRPMRGMHHRYRGIQPPPPGLGRNMYNGNPPGVIDDPLEAFERMLREKDERDRRLGKGRRRSRSRSRRSYTRSRSRSLSRRSPLPSRISRSRSPPPKRRSSRSPPPLRQRSRTPKRRSRSASVSISRSRSYSRSQSPRSSISRDRERDRERGRERNRDRDRDQDFPPTRYRSPDRPRPRFQREPAKSRESREKYNSYYNEPPGNEFGFRERERDGSNNRERSGYRYPPRNQTAHHNIPPLMPHLNAGAHPPQPQRSFGGPPQDRKDYYDSYNRYSGPPNQRMNSPGRKVHHKRIDDVAPPGTEGYYDLPPPGVDRDRARLSKERDREHIKDTETDSRDRMPLQDERIRERDDHPREKDERDRRVFDRSSDQDRLKEKEDRNRPIVNRQREERPREIDDREKRDKDKDRDEKYNRDHRDDERQMEKRDYEKERYRDDRDRHRFEDKNRPRERRERDYQVEKDNNRERYEKPVTDRKKFQKSFSPYSQKPWNEMKELSPERSRKKDKDYSDKADEKKREKKIKDKKKKKDSEEKEKKKKKKKEKKLTQKEFEKSEASKLIDETDKIGTDLRVEQLALAHKNTDVSSTTSLNTVEFEDKSLMMNPEPPEQTEQDLLRQDDTESGVNPPNPNFKPIPELKSEFKKSIDDHYSDLDNNEVKTTDTDEFSVLPNIEEDDIKDNEDEMNSSKSTSATEPEETSPEKSTSSLNKDLSIKRSEFLAPLPELSKWERDESTEKLDDVSSASSQLNEPISESKSTTEVTRDVLKRAENAIFQKAINAIRPIEIKKISENRKILYQNPEPKVFEPEINRDINKSLNVTVNIGKNERNVEITESSKKGKLDRTKFKLTETTHSPTRLSAKERLGEKIDDDKDKKVTISGVNNDRKVFIDDNKRERERERDHKNDRVHEKGDIRAGDKYDLQDESDRKNSSQNKNDSRSGRSDKNDKERERQIQTPPPLTSKPTSESDKIHHLLKRKRDQEDSDDKDDKKSRGDKKRKKDHRSRSKSREHKKRKEKKHKKDKLNDRKQKHKELSVKRDKQSIDSEDKSNLTNISNQEQSPARKQQQQQQHKNPKSISDRKRSILDEASFEPDYSASDSDSDNEDHKTNIKKIKSDEQQQFDQDKEICGKIIKRRVRSTSSDDNSNSSASSSTESDSSDDSSYRKRKKKHKKHKKRKSTKRDSSSEYDSDSDSTPSSSEEEKHKKKSKKSKSKKKQLKKKKKSKHK
ncbi:E3 ubiquitin-protein ligase RBBP6 isoform X2 [Microplitis demolitor]|uniref:E3 ubiquitin-protein ligase RBBP6 isoform X2 n=1 Tax=Microplitis demolitor TaxID=69319 RepID=UPI0004CD7CD8|nr:E3 ubiquitin-protein ligase RBBP6 isoform X2 [Microplitis demolitor]